MFNSTSYCSSNYGLVNLRAEKTIFAAIIVCVSALKLFAVSVGDPFLTVDDITAFDGGFLVWFGFPPPQRMYLESWIIGLVSAATFFFKALFLDIENAFSLDFFTQAYRDFYASPDAYLSIYRSIVVIIDAATVFFIYRITSLVFGAHAKAWIRLLPAIVYSLTYNTLWSDLVIRPDSITAFFATVGLFLYLKSDYGKSKGFLWGSAIAVGCAAGMKLHAAIIAVTLAIDLIRIHGFKRSMHIAFLFSLIAFVTFLIASGTAFVDPVLYWKLRALNYAHDVSPGISRIDQITTIFRGTNWVAIPLALLAAFALMRSKSTIIESKRVRTILLLTVIWMIVFLSIRQLRAYWMLPALPGLFILATAGLALMPRRLFRVGFVGLLVALTIVGFSSQLYVFKTTPYEQVTAWLKENARESTVLILGYDSLPIPRNTRSVNLTLNVLEARIRQIADEEKSFLRTHVRSWEERATIRKLQMLGGMDESGIDYYSFHSTPVDLLFDRLRIEEIDLVVVQNQFDRVIAQSIMESIGREAVLVDRFVGPGGGGDGLLYSIYDVTAESGGSD